MAARATEVAKRRPVDVRGRRHADKARRRFKHGVQAGRHRGVCGATARRPLGDHTQLPTPEAGSEDDACTPAHSDTRWLVIKSTSAGTSPILNHQTLTVTLK